MKGEGQELAFTRASQIRKKARYEVDKANTFSELQVMLEGKKGEENQ
jgi:hypothetical protein